MQCRATGCSNAPRACSTSTTITAQRGRFQPAKTKSIIGDTIDASPLLPPACGARKAVAAQLPETDGRRHAALAPGGVERSRVAAGRTEAPQRRNGRGVKPRSPQAAHHHRRSASARPRSSTPSCALDRKDVGVALSHPPAAPPRMAESTGVAKAIHRLLEIILSPAPSAARGPSARADRDRRRGEHDRHRTDAALLTRFPHATLVLVGDAIQLHSRARQCWPTSSPSQVIPVVRLTEGVPPGRDQPDHRRRPRHQRRGPRRRQGPEGAISSSSTWRRRGWGQQDRRVVTSRLPRRFSLDPVREIQVLTPMNKGSLGSQSLTQALREVLNPAREGAIVRDFGAFAPRDWVMQIDNDATAAKSQRRYRPSSAPIRLAS